MLAELLLVCSVIEYRLFGEVLRLFVVRLSFGVSLSESVSQRQLPSGTTPRGFSPGI